jgi:hypothetical protein
MLEPDPLELNRVGLKFQLRRIQGPSTSGHVRFSAVISNAKAQTRASYLFTPDELRALHSWITQQLAHGKLSFKERLHDR